MKKQVASALNKKLLYDLERYYKSKIPKRKFEGSGHIDASVVVILNRDLEMLFIKRTERSDDPYSGHMAFPGGKKKEADESIRFTAVREVNEEVGIDLERDAKVIGEMDPIKPLSPQGPRYVVTPFVAILENPKDLVISEEVDRCMWIPLFHFLNADNMRLRVKEINGTRVEDFVYGYGDHIIWGMTGKIVNSFINNVSVIL